ncbi:MAG: uracil phosphoribosyltransferase [Bacteroidales bacterium]|nr:uracil phosphoribosyltransferase [Bacteroidales bacterium]
MVHVLSASSSILNQYISEIRDTDIQRDSLRFRNNLERLGTIFGYEISKDLAFELKEVITPLGIANVPTLKEYPVLAAILRAGLPFHQGLLNVFDKSENAFISAFRKHHPDGSYTIETDYVSVPDIDDKIVILSDAMLASGTSMVLAYREMISHGKPKHTYLATILASSEGVEYVKKHLSLENISIWVGVIDEELTAQSFIVPGLGDAGDLAYGKKL